MRSEGGKQIKKSKSFQSHARKSFCPEFDSDSQERESGDTLLLQCLGKCKRVLSWPKKKGGRENKRKKKTVV